MLDDVANKIKGYNYSHAGKVSAFKFSYLLDKKSHIDKILEGKKRNKIVEVDFIDRDETFDDYENQMNENEFDDIFTDEYKMRHIMDLKEQRLKYFSNVKNPCTYIESKVKKKPKNKRNKSYNLPDDNKLRAKEELKKLLLFNNSKFSYYYHLLHHTDNSNFYLDMNNNIIFGPEVNATRYNPKLEFIYPKIIYSPSFKLMSGRYDQEILSKQLKEKIENIKIKKKEMERMKRLEKLKEIVSSKIDTQYKNPNFYNEKNIDFIKNNERFREINKLKRSNSFVIDIPMIKDKIIGDIEMEKQLQRGMLPEHHDVRIRIEKAFINLLNKYHNKTLEVGDTSNTLKGSVIYENNKKMNEQSSINNKNNSNLNNVSSINGNETIYTSNALKNELATLYNNNNNESNSNSNINIENNKMNNNSNFVNSPNLNKMKTIKNYNDNSQDNNTQKKFKKINFIQKKKFEHLILPKKTLYNTSSASNLFMDYNKANRASIKMSRTSAISIFKKKNNSRKINNFNNSMININSTTGKTVNFEKMLSREYLNNQGMVREPLHPQLNPKYDMVQPKCIMKVVYSNKTYFPKTIKRLEGLGEDVTFDADKIFYKYNDHFPTKSFYFNKMTGRNNSTDSYLPSYMVKLGNRYSCISFDEKSYKMNNFSEGHLKDQRSSFNQHKSFNWKLNMNLLDLNEINKVREEKSDIIKIYEKIKGANSMKNIRRKKIRIPGQNFLNITLKKSSNNILPEYYRVNLDKVEQNKEFCKNKIDGITLKSYIKKNANTLLSENDKRLFLVNSFKN